MEKRVTRVGLLPTIKVVRASTLLLTVSHLVTFLL